MASFINSLVQGTNDKVEIKSQVDLGGQSFKVFKQFIEEVEPLEIATMIEQRNLTGNIMVWGNSSFATWGTSLWGGTLPSYETVRVIPPNRTFIENFISDTFKNSSSTGSVSSGSLNMTGGEYYQTTVIYNNNEDISTGNVSLYVDSGESNISRYISSDDGANFTLVSDGVDTAIGTVGQEVVVKLIASGPTVINTMEVSV